MLDPRFKNLHFIDASACGKLIQKLKNLIDENMTMSLTSGSKEETANEDFNFWSHHKQLAVGQKRKHSLKADEVLIYLANPDCALKSNPLEEWEDLKSVFPALYKQARIYLNIVGTSVPSKRFFSKAGATITTLENLIFFIRRYKSRFLFIHFVLIKISCFALVHERHTKTAPI
jgi:hypothetical protein